MVASADSLFRGRVQVKSKGLLGRMTWTTRTCEVEDDVLRVFDKRGKVVVGVPLVVVSLRGVDGPGGGALEILDGAAKKSYTLRGTPAEAHEALAYVLGTRVAALRGLAPDEEPTGGDGAARLSEEPGRLSELLSSKLTWDYQERLSEATYVDEFKYGDEPSPRKRPSLAEAPEDDAEDVATPKRSKRQLEATPPERPDPASPPPKRPDPASPPEKPAPSLAERLFPEEEEKVEEASPASLSSWAEDAAAAMEQSTPPKPPADDGEGFASPPLVRCLSCLPTVDPDEEERASLTSQKVDKKAAKACGDFCLDVTAFGAVCKCGWPKQAHRRPALGRKQSSGRVAAVAAAFEHGLRSAAAKAAEDELVLRTRDPEQIAAILRARRREAAAKKRSAAPGRKAVPAPTVSNVADGRGAVVVRVQSKRKNGEFLPLKYCVVAEGGVAPEDLTTWTAEPSGVATFELADPGKVLVCAVSLDGGAKSDFATKYFELEALPALVSAKHEHVLKALDPGAWRGGACTVCCAPVVAAEGAFRCATCDDFVLCGSCASGAASVGVDLGAKRLWLSEAIQFAGGSDASILAESEGLVDLLATALKAHPAVAVRLEGHTNSCCNLGCDGTVACDNSRCAALEGGGAVGFSRRRAAAVKARLVAAGVDDAMVEAVGLAGSRRVVDDTESGDNWRNRRVEIHCA